MALLGGYNIEKIKWIISTIDCSVASASSGFVFVNSSGIHLKNLDFESCGETIPLRGDKHMHSAAALSFQHGSNIQLHSITVKNTRGFGLHTSNVFGSISISESAFLQSKGKKTGIATGNARFGLELSVGSSVQALA